MRKTFPFVAFFLLTGTIFIKASYSSSSSSHATSRKAKTIPQSVNAGMASKLESDRSYQSDTLSIDENTKASKSGATNNKNFMIGLGILVIFSAYILLQNQNQVKNVTL